MIGQDISKKGNEVLVSVVVPTFNRGSSINKCIDSILGQTYDNIELIVSDDSSTDNTMEILKQYDDKRIKIIKNCLNLGPAVARNEAIKIARGTIIFFTDDDVKVSNDWVENGVAYFAEKNVVGIEGNIIYVDASYKARYGDRIVENKKGGLFMTANAAYRRKELLEVGMFDPLYLQYEDRDLAIRLLSFGEIAYAKDVIVEHQHERYTLKSYMSEAKKIKYRLMLIERHGERNQFIGPVFEPAKLIVILLPPLVIFKMITSRYRDKSDLILALFIYPRLCYERLLLWRYCLKQKIFII